MLGPPTAESALPVAGRWFAAPCLAGDNVLPKQLADDILSGLIPKPMAEQAGLAAPMGYRNIRLPRRFGADEESRPNLTLPDPRTKLGA